MRSSLNAHQHAALKEWLDEKVGRFSCPMCRNAGWNGRWKGYLRLQPFPNTAPFEPGPTPERIGDLTLSPEKTCYEYEVGIDCWECGHIMLFSAKELIRELLRYADDDLPPYRHA